MTQNEQVQMFTDGACRGNPGPGGWGVVLRYGDNERQLFGGDRETTNNRMELLAVIEGLSVLKRPCEISITSDSTYVLKGIQEWLQNWKKRGWKTASKKPVANQDLWQRLDAAVARHTVRWHWVKGHAGNPLNERCDILARSAAEAIT